MDIHRVENGVIVETIAVDDPEPTPDILERAENARREAYDSVMAGGSLSMTRLKNATEAGSDAFLAVLNA